MTTVVTIKPALPNVVDTPSVGILPNLPVITGALGRLQASSFGTSALTFCQGNDTRVVNAVQTTGSYADPAWVTALAASKITGTFMKSQQHAQTPYKDEANTWALAQTFNGTVTINKTGSNGLVVNNTVGNALAIFNASSASVTDNSYLTIQTAGSDRWYFGQSVTSLTGNFEIYGTGFGGSMLTLNRTTGAMTVNAATFNGNVGIATSTPQRVLGIGGTSNAYMNFNPASGRQYTIGSDSNGFIVFDDTAGAYRFSINSTGATTFNGQVSAATEFRLGGNSFSRVAQMDGAGGWGGGYNFNVNSSTSQRDSTGTVAAIRFDLSSVQLFAESSGSPGAISPRYSFGPTQATFVSPLGINNGSGVGRIGLGPDSFIQADANEMVVSQRGAGSLYQDFGTSTIFRRTSDFATMATIASNGTANFLSTVTTPSVVSHGLTIVDGITGASNWRFYKNASDTNLYLRNEINARMHAVFSVGADSNDSNSHFCSRLTAEGGIYSARNESWIGFSDNNNYLGGITHFRPVAGGSTAVTINGATGAATFNSTVSADAFRHRNSAGEFPWMLYSPGTDVNWYIRDMVNSRMQMMFTPGASAGAAVTNVYSQLTVEGNATFNGTITAQSDRPVKSYFGFTTYQGDAGGYIIGSRFRGPSDTDLGFIGVHGTGDNLYTYFIGVYGNEIVSFNNTNKAATFNGSVKLGIKTIATLPSAASSSGERYQVSDSATIANRIAFSNGSAWYYEGTAVAV